MPSIELNETAPALGDTVTFTINRTGIPKKYKDSELRVEIKAYQPTCAPGYSCGTDDQTPAGQVQTYGEGGATAEAFVLGGGGSAWLEQGGPAECVANLFVFDHSGPTGTYLRFASAAFQAAG